TRGEGLVVQPDAVLDPAIEFPLPAGVLDGRGGTPARLELEDLLRAAGSALVVALEGALGPIDLAVEQEIELDEQAVRVLVDQRLGVLAPAPVMAEEGIGDGVENGRLPRPVEPRQHPQGGVAIELDGLFLLVAEETLEPDVLRNHECASLSRASAR